jgi:predicted amidohydrolase YtcJ
MQRLVLTFIAVVFGVSFPAMSSAQAADTVFLNGKIVAADSRGSVHQALAVREGNIVAIGRSVDVGRLIGAKSRVVDLRGRTVIPGLIDSHIHAIRAALSYATEVHWIGVDSLDEALERLRVAARDARPGAWLIVAGGWTEQQFKEKRRPMQAELVRAAPNNPVYVQLFYEWAMLTPEGMRALNIREDADVPPRGKLDRDASGAPNGGITGDGSTITTLFDRLPTPTFEQQVDGTVRFFRELNRYGITGIVDPGGFNMPPENYRALMKVWRDRKLSLRVAFSLFAQNRGKEIEEFERLTPLMPMGFGDEWLRFNGVGERVTFGMYNNDKPSSEQKEDFYKAARWAADRGMSLTAHWHNDASVGQLLDVFERVHKEVPIDKLRWSIAHLNDASGATLQRMKALGVGWTVQNAMYFGGDLFAKMRGPDVARRAPPINTGLRVGLPMGAGTDAHRVMSHNPFVALRWLADGVTVSGTALRGAEETPTRLQALAMYTSGSAWFAHGEQRRGTLEPGKLADLAVLSADYLSVPADQIGKIESQLTMVGGRIVYATGEYAKHQEPR